MAKSPLRKDKTCLNCRHVVDNRFCPNCGQENTDTRKTFHHLFVHFFEDLTHYESSFWKTIRNLIFKPASLTKEYLSGKRMSYLAPIRLYIFISFITFFIIAVLPDGEGERISTTNDSNPMDRILVSDQDTIRPKKAISKKSKWIVNMEQNGVIDHRTSDSLQKQLFEREQQENSSERRE